MSERNRGCPKGSEVPIKEWLQQIGAMNIRFTGDLYHGPLDFVVEYGGEEVAVEVTRLHDEEGWGKNIEYAILRKARELYNEACKKGWSWHGYIEYDPRESKKPMKGRSWQERMRKALQSDYGGEFQLLSPEHIKGEGVILHLWPASNKGGISQVSDNRGILLCDTLSERIINVLEIKTEKSQKEQNSNKYRQWWLVFDDKILVAPRGILMNSETPMIEDCVRNCPSRRRWSKIVLVSRFQFVPPPAKPPKRFWPLWEDGEYPILPKSPRQ